MVRILLVLLEHTLDSFQQSNVAAMIRVVAVCVALLGILYCTALPVLSLAITTRGLRTSQEMCGFGTPRAIPLLALCMGEGSDVFFKGGVFGNRHFEAK